MSTESGLETQTHLESLGSELTLYAARLVRWLRSEREQPTGMRVLSILDELGPTGVTALAAADQCSQPTMTGAVNGLVERGWVTKQTDPDDARATFVTLTKAGSAVLRKARRSNGALVVSHLGEDLDEAELATAVRVMKTLLQKGNS